MFAWPDNKACKSGVPVPVPSVYTSAWLRTFKYDSSSAPIATSKRNSLSKLQQVISCSLPLVMKVVASAGAVWSPLEILVIAT